MQFNTIKKNFDKLPLDKIIPINRLLFDISMHISYHFAQISKALVYSYHNTIIQLYCLT